MDWQRFKITRVLKFEKNPDEWNGIELKSFSTNVILKGMR
jgi:hypothetical protein